MASLQNPQTFESTPVSVSTGAGEFVAPFIAAAYADASGTVGTLQAVNVTITGIDRIFDVTLTQSESAKILNAFQITDISAGYGESALAEIKVDMKAGAKTAFVEALATAMLKEPAANADAAGASLYQWLKAESRKDTVDALSYDTLINLLEASDLLSYDIAIDASGGATNMFEAMDAGAAAYRKAIAMQIPESNYNAYVPVSDGSALNNEDIAGLNFLPLVHDDKLVLVFDFTVGEYGWANAAPTSGAKMARAVNDASVATGTNTSSGSGMAEESTYTSVGNGSVYADGTLLFTAPSKRRVALKLKMQKAEGSGALPLAGALSDSVELQA
jgi:hypothetical protein